MRICKDGRVWGQNNKEAGSHLGIATGRYVKKGHNPNSKGRPFQKGHSGEKCHLWKGGISSHHDRIRKSIKYKQWRSDIFIRDNFTCQICGDNKGGNLRAHHIKPFFKLLEEIKNYLPLIDLYNGAMMYKPMWLLDNGITLCVNCHKLKHKER